MSDSQTQPVNKYAALQNYGIGMALLFGMGILLYLDGDAANLIFLKLAGVPLFWLSTLGLSLLVVRPINEAKITLKAVEFALLQALIFTCFMVPVSWKPDASLASLAGRAFFGFTIMSIANLGMMMVSVRRNKTLNNEPS